jgi:hypothetical protein
MPKAAVPKPVVLNAVAQKPVGAKRVMAPKINHPVAKNVVAWRPAGKARPGSGISAANEKVFARLAAEHRAQLAKEHKSETAKLAKNGRAGTGRSANKSGVTP